MKLKAKIIKPFEGPEVRVIARGYKSAAEVHVVCDYHMAAKLRNYPTSVVSLMDDTVVVQVSNYEGTVVRTFSIATTVSAKEIKADGK